MVELSFRKGYKMASILLTRLEPNKRRCKQMYKKTILDSDIPQHKAQTRLYKFLTDYRTKTKEGYQIVLKENHLQVLKFNEEIHMCEGWEFDII